MKQGIILFRICLPWLSGCTFAESDIESRIRKLEETLKTALLYCCSGLKQHKDTLPLQKLFIGGIFVDLSLAQLTGVGVACHIFSVMIV